MSTDAIRPLIVRLAILAAACAAALLTGFGRLARRRAVTLCYHGVTGDQRQRFARQMSWLARHAASGRPRVAVTFDDAYANLLDNALPVTRALGIPVTVFVVTGNLGDRPRWRMRPGHHEAREITMNAAQIAAARIDPLVSFGSHSTTHRDLTELDRQDAKAELAGSKVELAAILGREIEDFAFPYGAGTASLIQAAFDAGYRRVWMLDDAPDRPAQAGQVLTRVPMSPGAWPIEFRLACVGAYGLIAPLRRFVRRATARLGRFPAKLRSRGPITGSMKDDSTGHDQEIAMKSAVPAPNGLHSRKTRILAVASGGGHWVQLLRLRPAFAGEDVVYVTVDAAYRADVGTAPMYVVNDATRWSKWALLSLAVRMTWIVLRQRPDVVVTTGAAPGYFAVMIGKLLGARTAWLDSMANVQELSLAGRKAGRWTDLWLTQWPGLARADGPRHEGTVL